MVMDEPNHLSLHDQRVVRRPPGARELLVDNTLVVVPWHDPVVDTNGHCVLSRYVEHFWLPVLGPSALWILRRIVIGFEEFPGGFEIDVPYMAAAVGLSFNAGANSSFTRSLQRCTMFGAAQALQGGLAVRQFLPTLSNRQLQRLPLTLRQAHPKATAQSSP
jgi:hypothetical protein